jgi:hypothetical protein
MIRLVVGLVSKRTDNDEPRLVVTVDEMNAVIPVPILAGIDVLLCPASGRVDVKKAVAPVVELMIAVNTDDFVSTGVVNDVIIRDCCVESTFADVDRACMIDDVCSIVARLVGNFTFV